MSGTNPRRQRSASVKPRNRAATASADGAHIPLPAPELSEVHGGPDQAEDATDADPKNEEFTTKGETKLEIGGAPEEENNYDDGTKLVKGKSNNPKITISAPISSPCKVVQEPQKRCPIYFGIKSYIHDFYHPPDKDVFKNEEYYQEDDFRFLVEPGKRRWRNWWLRVALWVGVNLMLLGLIALLVGHLTAPRQPIVHQQDNFTVLDRWAVTFNNRLVICQLAGLAAFTSGAVVVMLALLVSSYQSPGYYVMTATLVPESMMAAPQAGLLSRIPLTGSVRGVQPTFVRTG